MDIGNSVERGFTVFFAWLPALLGASGNFEVIVFGLLMAMVLQLLVSPRVLAAAWGVGAALNLFMLAPLWLAWPAPWRVRLPPSAQWRQAPAPPWRRRCRPVRR